MPPPSTLYAEPADLRRTGAASGTALYAGHAKIERSIAALGALRRGVAGKSPLPEAQALIADIDGFFDTIGVALKQALGVFEVAIDRFEWAASRDRRAVR